MTRPSVTILAYHAIGDDGPGPVCLPRAIFERQVAGLAEAGCRFLELDDVVAHLRSGSPFPPRAVALTFDDAYESVHRHALPFLDRLGLTATVFPVTSELGGHNRWDAATGAMPELALVSGSQLDELVAAGWQVGGHTHTHRPLTSLAPAEVGEELNRSNAVLEDRLGRAITTMAYPYGCHDATVRTAAAARYDGCLAIGAARARVGSPLDRIDRVDAWYLQRPWQVGLLPRRGGDLYLWARRCARGAGRRLRRST